MREDELDYLLYLFHFLTADIDDMIDMGKPLDFEEWKNKRIK